MQATLSDLETWHLRALSERRARAQLAMNAARIAHDQANQDLQRTDMAINAALLAASARAQGPADANKLSVTLPPDDALPGTIEWQDEPPPPPPPTGKEDAP